MKFNDQVMYGECDNCKQQTYFYSPEKILFHENGSDVSDTCPNSEILSMFNELLQEGAAI